MSSRRVLLIAVVFMILAAPGAAGQESAPTQRFAGRAANGDAMSFVVASGVVNRFTFVNACPGVANGTPVSAEMKVVDGHFSYHDSQFAISGFFLWNGLAEGTERDHTGDCDSGLLRWTAHPSPGTIAPSSRERAAMLRAAREPALAGTCLIARVAASNPNYGTILVRSETDCARWQGNGVSVYERAQPDRWRLVFAGSAYKCPMMHVPRSVQRDLGVCPMPGSKPGARSAPLRPFHGPLTA
jgi:hypothetical protein